MTDIEKTVYSVRMENIYKSFGKVKALDDVSFYLRPGEIRALVGENGAGKTTLMNILYGMYLHDKGEIYIGDIKAPDKWTPSQAIKMGLGMIHQHFSLVNNHTVLENVVMPTLKWDDYKPEWKKYKQKIEKIVEEHQFDVKLTDKVESLSIGQRQQVEIIKALYQGAKVIILDEPSNVLTPKQAEGLFKLLLDLKKKNFSIVLVTHKLSEVMDFSDRITVLRDGKHICTVETSKTTVQEIAKKMVDRERLIMPKVNKDLSNAENIIEIENLSVENEEKLKVLSDVSFNIRKGEILAIAGAAGNGQVELAEAIIGLRNIKSGDILLEGKSIKNENIEKRCIAGIGYIPEDRHNFGIVPDMSIAENLVLNCVSRPPFSQKGIINHKEIKDNSDKAIVDFTIKTEDGFTPIRNLSGGNQQKVILAKTLMDKPKLIVACNPTRGLDFSATDYLRKKLVESAYNDDVGVFLYSCDLDELLQLGDRILVIYQGRVMGIVDRSEVDMEKLGMMMAGFSYEEKH